MDDIYLDPCRSFKNEVKCCGSKSVGVVSRRNKARESLRFRALTGMRVVCQPDPRNKNIPHLVLSESTSHNIQWRNTIHANKEIQPEVGFACKEQRKRPAKNAANLRQRCRPSVDNAETKGLRRVGHGDSNREVFL